jgi:hypothetical protein
LSSSRKRLSHPKIIMSCHYGCSREQNTGQYRGRSRVMARERCGGGGSMKPLCMASL